MKGFFKIPDPEVEGYPVVWSPNRLHRYILWRVWRPTKVPRYIVWIGLNPSTATESVNDNTITRCIYFSKRWGFEAMAMLNLFAYRSTDPAKLKELLLSEAVGDDNDKWIKRITAKASRTIVCWGTNGSLYDRDQEVKRLLSKLRNVHALKINSDGSPLHPLYAPANTIPKKWKRWQ